MPYFQYQPKNSKPNDLDPICRDLCDKYEETTGAMHQLRRVMYGNPYLSVHFRRCRFHPMYCDPDDIGKCPFKQHFGKQVIAVDCDICHKLIRLVDPLSQEFEHRAEHRSDEGKSLIDVCEDCRRKGL